MGLADERKPVNLMTVHVSKSVTVHEVSNTFSFKKQYKLIIDFLKIIVLRFLSKLEKAQTTRV